MSKWEKEVALVAWEMCFDNDSQAATEQGWRRWNAISEKQTRKKARITGEGFRLVIKRGGKKGKKSPGRIDLRKK